MSRRTHLDPQDELALADLLARTGEDAVRSGERRQAVDGRHARSERSRQAMVDALLELLREGNVRPSSAQIAERAGVTQRTLFNQFGDMDSLVREVATRQAQRFLELQPQAGTGTLDERVHRYCGGLELLLEETMHVRWALVTTATGAPSATQVMRAALHFTRRQLQTAFAPELDALDEVARDEVLDALELETDPVVWRMRRVHQELTTAEARAVIERTILGLLCAAPRRDPDGGGPADSDPGTG